jgi:hypothetical protein
MLLIAIAEGDGPWRTDVIAEALRRWLFISDQGGVETFYAAEETIGYRLSPSNWIGFIGQSCPYMKRPYIGLSQLLPLLLLSATRRADKQPRGFNTWNGLMNPFAAAIRI